jgi:hypothetical protein
VTGSAPSQPSLDELLDMSSRTLAEAGAPEGLLGFTALPVRLAIETLAVVESRGAGAKVPRASVARATQELAESLHGDPSALRRLLSGDWLAPGT